MSGTDDALTPDEGAAPAELTAAQVIAAGRQGSLAIVGRNLGVKALTMIGGLALVRLLEPNEYGAAVLAFTVCGLAVFVLDGGLGGALVRRPEEPSRRELGQLLGLQLGLAVAIAVVVAALAFELSGPAGVTAVALASLPGTALRGPGMIHLERRLRFGTMAWIESVESVGYVCSAIAFALAGLGAYSLALAVVLRALVGTALIWVVVPAARIRPSFALDTLRSLLGFGAKLQLSRAAPLIREQGTNLLISLLGGLTALAFWGVSVSLLQVPLLVMASLWRVSFPSLSRLVAIRGRLHHELEVAARLVAVPVTVLSLGIATAAPGAVPILLGERWEPAVEIIVPFACLFVLVGGVSAVVPAYLSVISEFRPQFVASLAAGAVTSAILIVTVPRVGIDAAGYASLAGGLTEATLLVRSLHRFSSARVVRAVLPGIGVALVAGVVGAAVNIAIGSDALAMVCAPASACSVYLVGMFVVDRDSIIRLLRIRSTTTAEQAPVGSAESGK